MRNQLTPSVTRDLLIQFQVSQEDYEIAFNSCSIYELSASWIRYLIKKIFKRNLKEVN